MCASVNEYQSTEKVADESAEASSIWSRTWKTRSSAKSSVSTASQKTFKKMDILIVTNHFMPESFRINDLAKDLVNRGHKVSVLTSIPYYPIGKYFDGYGLFSKRKEVEHSINIQRVPVIPRGSGSALRMLLNYTSSCVAFCTAALISRRKHDVVFVFGTSPLTIGLPALITRFKHGTPIVLWVLDLWPESLRAAGGVSNLFVLSLIRKIINAIYRQCECIFISCKGFSASISPFIHKNRTSIEHLPNWVEPPVVSDSDIDLPKLPDGFRIVFTGNVGEAQDFEKILESAVSLKGYKDIHWILVGEGRKLDWIKEQVALLDLQDNIHLFGSYPRENMAYFYKYADCLLLSLKDDEIFHLTVPGKLQAYMDSGRPVLAAISGESADLIHEADCGLVSDTNDSESFAKTVVKMYQLEASDRDRLGRNGKNYSDSRYNRNKLFDRVEQVLASCVHTKEISAANGLS